MEVKRKYDCIEYEDMRKLTVYMNELSKIYAGFKIEYLSSNYLIFSYYVPAD